MDIGRKVKDEAIERIIADQQCIITHILSTRQSLRRIQSQRIQLHRDLRAECRKVNSDNKAVIDSYEANLAAHGGLAGRLEDDLERWERRLADTDSTLERLVGPLHVELWHESVGLTNAKLLEQWNRLVVVLYWACIVLIAVYVGLVVFSVLWVAANPEDRAPLMRLPRGERYRSVVKPLWDQGTFAMDRYRDYYYSGNLQNPLYGAVTDDEIEELKEYLEADRRRLVEGVRSGVPVRDFRKTWNTIRKEAEIQEGIFREYARKVREAEGLDGEPTRQEVEQYRLDWVKGPQVKGRATVEFDSVDPAAGEVGRGVEKGGDGIEKMSYGVEIIDKETEEEDDGIEEKEGQKEDEVEQKEEEIGLKGDDKDILKGWSILD